MLQKTFVAVFLIVLAGTFAFAQGQDPQSKAPQEKVQVKKEESWHKLDSTEGKFTVLMPVKPEVEISEVPSEIGSLKLYKYSTYVSPTVYMAAFNDFPVESVKTEEIDAVLDSGRDGGIGAFNGKVISEKKISLNNYPGREIVGQGKLSNGETINIKIRIFLVKKRLYQILALTSSGVETPDITKFLLSFELVK